MSNKYWSSIEELNGNIKPKNDSINKEGDDSLLLNQDLHDAKASRRDFLKMCGFSISAAAFAASCKAPVQKAIPYLVQPVDVKPGIANYYASTYASGTEYASVLVKTREGRPIKIEGNEKSNLNQAGTSARVQASVLDLYDNARLRFPSIRNKKITWEEFDNAFSQELSNIRSTQEPLILLTSSICSPSIKKMISEFIEEYPNIEWIVYDSSSYYGMLSANEQNFGKKVIPDYHFEKASYILSFGADFLGTWLAPTTFASRYAEARRPTPEKPYMSKHVQFESNMSLSGTNADERIPMKPSDIKLAIFSLYNNIAARAGVEKYELDGDSHFDMSTYAEALWNAKEQSIVISGSNDPNVQKVINAINQLLLNYGNTIDIDTAWLTAQSDDKAMISLVERMNNSEISGLVIYDCNPAYDYPEATQFIEGLKNIEFTASLSYKMDETASLCRHVGALNHFLESWGDAEPVEHSFSLMQPAIEKLFDTRSFADCLLKWKGDKNTPYSYLRNYWHENIMPLQNEITDFEGFWTVSLRDGVFHTENNQKTSSNYLNNNIKETLLSLIPGEASGKFEISVFENISIGSGRQSNNPWLLEMPDPVSKATWGNQINISPFDAKEIGAQTNDVAKVGEIELPVLVQPGQAKGSISIALGYGRSKVGKAGDGVGANAFPLTNLNNDHINYMGNSVELELLERKEQIAFTQTHHTLENRPLIHESNLAKYAKTPIAGNELHEEIKEELYSLYADVVFNGPHWGLSIDLNACIGCGSCIIACQAENNVAVIGKDQVAKNRIMHWIRIDRYYSGDSDNPSTNHLPVMCQQCDHAPCENVCPVAATMHNEEGINQMTYVRCIGTRYCMNNCPYRVRRFNWYDYANNDKFDYNMNNELSKMVLNPDAVVRSRGVVEKCSFCIQRIQDAKSTAKLENRAIRDGELKSACMQSCPTKAIVFGDLNNEDSAVSKLFENERNYYLLEELHTLPSVGYLTKIRNTDENITS